MLRFPDLLRAIALGSLGASAGCAGHTIDLSRYDLSVCSAEGKYHPVRGLVGTLGVDYVVLYGGYGTPSVVDEDGKACATATDPAACATQLWKASSGSGGWGSGEVPMLRFLVTTRGDEVRAYRTLADLRTLLQPVDSAKEAALLLSESGHRIQCNYLNARKVAAGYEIVTETGNTCGETSSARSPWCGRMGAPPRWTARCSSRATPTARSGDAPKASRPSARARGSVATSRSRRTWRRLRSSPSRGSPASSSRTALRGHSWWRPSARGATRSGTRDRSVDWRGASARGRLWW
ncbi:MAG: hypothetical protein IPJ34_18465 [Myxococcales bacterium]|nr:hypothetical protein [Myxococcales bacterium]